MATFNGLIILKTRSFELPFGTHERVEGSPATYAGYGLIVLGLLSLLTLAVLFVG